jgi:nucleoid-associated protein YgaU
MTTENQNNTEQRVHVVEPGENLSAIAQKYYGAENAAHWITIYNFNREVVGDNPDFIQAGISLVIPDLTEFLTD